MEAIFITFAVVLASHLGLCEALASVAKPLGRTFRKVIRCPKCLTFWLTAAYQIGNGHAVLASVMISLICAYSVQWIILALEFIYKIYVKLWQKMINDK